MLHAGRRPACHGDGFLFDGQHRRVRVFRPHGRIVDEGPLPPLGDGLGIKARAFG